MNYIIPKEKLYKTIYEFIDDFMKEQRIGWFYTNRKIDKEYEAEFTGEDYEVGDDNTPLFTWVSQHWFDDLETDEGLIEKYKPLAPFLEISGYTKFRKKMDGLFGEVWRPVFEEWFKNTFDNFEIKTFIYL